MEEDESEKDNDEDEEGQKKPDDTAMEEEGKVNLRMITASTNVTRCRNGMKEESPYQGQVERDQRKETAEIAHCHKLPSSTCLLPLSRALKLGRKSNDIETNQNLTNKLNEHNK
jgi:hypothetical protein